MRILGIDPGTATVGWAVLEEDSGTLKALGFGHFSTPAKTPLPTRLLEIARDLEGIVARYAPEEAGIESLFFFNNQKTAIAVAQARGAILLTLERLGLPMAEYTPLQVKQALTGYGQADKKQVQLMVKSILRLDAIPTPDDAADAVAIALCHCHSRKINGLRR